MVRKVLFVMLSVVFLSSVCIAGEVNVKKIAKSDWINIETATFNVLTNAKETKAMAIVEELEDFKYFLAGSLGYEQRDLSEKIPVVVAKNAKTFSAMGMPDNYAGLFVTSPGYVIFARADRFRSASDGGTNWGRSVVFHELVHLFLRNATLNFALPIWFEEGIAEYYGTYVEKDDKVIIGSLGVLENRFADIRDVEGQYEYVDTEKLFKIDQKELSIGEGNSTKEREFLGKFYARASIVVHYMYADGERMKQMYQYLYLLKKGVTEDEAFSQVFKMSYAELDRAVYNYMTKWALTGLSYGGIQFPEVSHQQKEMGKEEAMGFLYSKISVLSENFLGEGTQKTLYVDMEELYPGLADKVIAEQYSEYSKNMTWLMRMALTYQALEKYKDAIDLYEQALVLESSNAGIMNNLAWLLATVPDMTLRNPQRAVSLAKRAVAGRVSAGHLDTLAEAHYANGSFQKAIDVINEAIILAPDNKYYEKQLKKFMAAKEDNEGA
jgi:tetratricopeptide (TPR) repeat protein